MKFSLNCYKIWIHNRLNSNYDKMVLFCIFLFVIQLFISGKIVKSFFISLALFILCSSLLFSLCILGLFCGCYYRKNLFKDDRTITRVNNKSCSFAVVLISNSQSYELGSDSIIRMLKNLLTNMNMCSVYLLCKYFEERRYNYILFEKVIENDLDYFIQNDNCEEIYLFGHGSRGSFVTSNRIIEYSEYIKYRKNKRIVSQFHCNHYRCDGNNLSLTEILAFDKKNSYLTSGSTMFPDHLWYCAKLLLKAKLSLSEQNS